MADRVLLMQTLFDIFFTPEPNIRIRNLRRRYFRKRKQNAYVFLQNLQGILMPAFRDCRYWSKVRPSDWWDSLVAKAFKDPDFKKDFRVSRSTFLMLCNQLEPLLKKKSFRKPISVQKRVGITLIKLGTCGELRGVAREFGVARSTACKIVNEVCRAICETFPITFPTGNKLQEVADGFIAKGGLPGCCGALDGSFIRIKAPVHNAKDFYCRKQCHAILLQAVVDSSTSFINVTVGWPGSVHDARVFRNSKLYRAGLSGNLFLPQTISIQNVQTTPFIVADQAYPALTWLKKPYGGLLNDNQKAFNKTLSKGRICVEHAFGQLKGRWRCLLKENDSNIENLKVQVMACCILHNLCKLQDDEYLENWDVEEEEILL